MTLIAYAATLVMPFHMLLPASSFAILGSFLTVLGHLTCDLDPPPRCFHTPIAVRIWRAVVVPFIIVLVLYPLYKFVWPHHELAHRYDVAYTTGHPGLKAEVDAEYQAIIQAITERINRGTERNRD
eukprot:1694969-Prymnesium_polylepis.1